MCTILKAVVGTITAFIGLVLFAGLALAVFFGSFFRHTEVVTELKDYYEEASDVTAIYLDIDTAELKIREGDSFSVSVNNIPEGCFSSTVKDGTWTVDCNYIVSQKTYLHIFCWDIPIRTSKGNYIGSEKPQITLTVPKDFNASDWSITLGAGSIYAKKISTGNANFNIGAGKFEADAVTISQSASLVVGAGSMDITDLTADNVKIDCGVGSVSLSGSITGSNQIKCGIGHVALNLTTTESDYRYSVNCGIGKVRIGSLSSVSHSTGTFGNSSAENSFTLDCGIGSIEMDFEQEPSSSAK